MIAEKSNGHSSSVISPPPPIFFGCSPPDAKRKQRMAVCDGGRACDGVAVISDTTAATHRRQSEAAHAWCVMVAVRVEFRGSEDLARPPANPADARRQRMAVAVVQKLGGSRTGSCKPTADARRQRMAVVWSSKARSSKARQAEKLLTKSKTEKAPVRVRRMPAASAALPVALSIGAQTGRRTGRDGGAEDRPERPGAEKFRPLDRHMITSTAGGAAAEETGADRVPRLSAPSECPV